MSSEHEASPRMQKAAQFFKFGNDAALKNNFDYAVQMYREACKLFPENLIYRQALRGTGRRKFGNEPSKVGRLVGMRVQPIRLQIKAAKSRSQWSNVIEACEDALSHNPWDVPCSMDLAEASENLGLKEVARWAMESVRPQVTNDIDFLKYMAHIYEINGDFPKAIEVWEVVRKLVPHDEDARRMINQLSATATINRSGLGESINRANAKASEPTDAQLEELRRKEPQLTEEQRLEKDIQEAPTRVNTYLNLADLLRSHNKIDEAEKVLLRGLKAIPDNPDIKTAHAEVQIARLKRALDQYEKKFASDPGNTDVETKLKQLREMHGAYEMKELRRRVESSPEDNNLKLQLGQKLLKLGQVDAAIAEFQLARTGPTKVEALFQLGQAFEAKNLPKLAERNYAEALKSADKDDIGLMNRLHYWLGRVAETIGDKKAAEEHYNEVAANDFSYLDVATRLENLNRDS